MLYQQWENKLIGRCKDRHKVGNHTWLVRRADSIALRLHNTDIVTAFPNGTLRLNTGGWRTVTTKARMNQWLPFGNVYQKDYEWWLTLNGRHYLYHDGVVLNEQTQTFNVDQMLKNGG